MAGPDLILVRHAAPWQQPDIPPPMWRLSPTGRADAERLAEQLADLAPAAICASTEPKAIETAEVLARRHGLPVTPDAAFDEHRRARWPYEPDPEAVRARVLRVLAEPESSVDGAEAGSAAARRFAAGLAAHAARPLLLVSHGTILSLRLGATGAVDAPSFWTTLRMPEALLVGANGALVGRIG